MSDSETSSCPAEKGIREVWRKVPGDFYSPSIEVFDNGNAVRVNVGGSVVTMSIEAWHAAALRTAESEAVRLREAVGNLLRHCTARGLNAGPASDLLVKLQEAYDKSPAAAPKPCEKCNGTEVYCHAICSECAPKAGAEPKKCELCGDTGEVDHDEAWVPDSPCPRGCPPPAQSQERGG
jgi:hypothetical protein